MRRPVGKADLAITVFAFWLGAGGCLYEDECLAGATRSDGLCRFEGGTDGGSSAIDGSPADGGRTDGGAADGSAADGGGPADGSGRDGYGSADGAVCGPLAECGESCVDLLTDPGNCGSCGRVCTWECADGECAQPQELAVLGGSTCLLVSSGHVYCWGGNLQGQVGIGGLDTAPVLVPTRLTGLTQVLHIYGSTAHVCAVDGTGTTHCWGMNGAGQLGDGTMVERREPTVVPALAMSADMGLGSWSSCQVHATGLRCWGTNAHGELGNGAPSGTPSTVPVLAVGVEAPTEVEVGDHHGCVISGDRRLMCWGENSSGQIGVAGTEGTVVAPREVTTGVAQVSTNEGHTCARMLSGAVHCWGDNIDGQIGDGTIVQRNTPTAVGGLGTATDIATGKDFSCAVVGGEVYCWGANASGQGGRSETSSSSTPVAVTGLSAVTDIAAGQGWHACAISDREQVLCWGSNAYGQIGNGDSGTLVFTPTPVITPGSVR